MFYYFILILFKNIPGVPDSFSLLLNLIMFHPTFVLIQSLNLAGGHWRTAGRFLFVDVPVSNLLPGQCSSIYHGFCQNYGAYSGYYYY